VSASVSFSSLFYPLQRYSIDPPLVRRQTQVLPLARTVLGALALEIVKLGLELGLELDEFTGT
jgi:hypothetical protein